MFDGQFVLRYTLSCLFSIDISSQDLQLTISWWTGSASTLLPIFTVFISSWDVLQSCPFFILSFSGNIRFKFFWIWKSVRVFFLRIGPQKVRIRIFNFWFRIQTNACQLLFEGFPRKMVLGRGHFKIIGDSTSWESYNLAIHHRLTT